ncbi:unnamed protein product [Gemmataceae bacterium]|nr:unnamed protein product [Gemmataceae bacterium]VTU02756.1 unnamed protein product [Gemmataceae bacterium]
MNTRTIVVTPYQATVVPRATEADPKASARVRYRWRAELVEGDGTTSLKVEGYLAPDAAIGVLIREAMFACETHEQLLDLVAGLFGDTAHRPAEVVMARAVRFANGNPKREHPGVKVVIHQPEPIPVPPVKRLPAVARQKRKGGAL